MEPQRANAIAPLSPAKQTVRANFQLCRVPRTRTDLPSTLVVMSSSRHRKWILIGTWIWVAAARASLAIKTWWFVRKWWLTRLKSRYLIRKETIHLILWLPLTTVVMNLQASTNPWAPFLKTSWICTLFPQQMAATWGHLTIDSWPITRKISKIKASFWMASMERSLQIWAWISVREWCTTEALWSPTKTKSTTSKTTTTKSTTFQ